MISLIIVLTLLMKVNSVYLQQDMCPKVCKCDENLEVRCNSPFNANGLPHTLSPLTKRLIVNYAQTTHITSSDITSYPELEHLDLAFNKLTTVDFECVRSNQNLLSLNVSHNNIVEVKDSVVSSAINRSQSIENNIDESEVFKSLKKSRINIVELSMSNNLLSIIKSYTFIGWHKLVRLDISHNIISTLESNAFAGLIRLEYINLSHNKLTRIPSLPFLGTTKTLAYSASNDMTESSLKSIDLSYNPLVSIYSNSFKSLKKAREIYLDYASLQFIDSGAFSDLSTLNTLSLSNNNLTVIPSESFRALESLKSLNIDSNRIETIRANAFSHLQTLQELQINNGTVSVIEPGAFDGLVNLRHLELAFNPNLTRIPLDVLDQLHELKYINLRSNSLASVPIIPATMRNPFAVVDLRSNRLFCDCDLKWLTRWLNTFNATILDLTRQDIGHEIRHRSQTETIISDPQLVNELLNLTCAGPPALEGKLVLELPDNKLECLAPKSELHLNIGFFSLSLMLIILTLICSVNLCRSDTRLFWIIKENLVQSRKSMILPTYAEQNLAKLDNNKIETQMGSADYEPVEYSRSYWPIYLTSNQRQPNSSGH